MKAPSPCEFRRSVELAVSVEEAFAFHENPHNIRSISPSWQTVRVLKGSEVARVDDEFEIEVRLLGLIPLRWRGIWREVSTPDRLVDGALSSPFAYWRHRHLFERLEGGHTRMTDHVSYLFPGGWMGKWFGETFGRIQFHLMFADRQKRTARWLGERTAR